MTPMEIMAEARRLKDERFRVRFKTLEARADERFNRTTVDVPKAYKRTAHQHRSNLIEDEGRQIGTLVYALPTPHITPPTPKEQALTTKIERFLIAAHQELEDKNGPVWWQCTSAQTHNNLGWIYTAPKKVAYKGQPKAPKDDVDDVTFAEYTAKNERFKKDAGISAVFDYEYATTDTVLYEGGIYDPHCVYVWKQVPLLTMRKQYGVERKYGKWTPVEKGVITTPGYAEGTSTSETMVTVVEYWDRQMCQIVVEQGNKDGHELTSWKHNFGRVPYFPRPAFVTDQLEEDKKFSGPLDGLHNEMPEHKMLRTMSLNIAGQISFASYQIVSKETGEVIYDDTGQPLIFLELEAAQARQLAPGQEIKIVPQSPEIGVLFQEQTASQQRIEKFSLSPVARGVSPGADTANASLSNLHQLQLSTLRPMALEASRQARAIYRFWLEQIRKGMETYYVLDQETDKYLSLNSEDIITVNVQAKVTPDQGQQQLLIEKHAMELWQVGFITEEEAHEKRGKENPEEYVKANMVERLRKTLEPVILQQVVTDLGMLDAVNQMLQANAQTGDARNAIPGLQQQAAGLDDPTGMGSGSPGQPRTPGTRMPTESINTQEAMANGH